MKKLMIAMLLLTTSVYFGQERLNFDLDQCIDLALKNNHDLQQRQFEFEKAEEQVREAYGNSLFPKIDGTVNYNRAIKRGEIIIETPFFSGSFPAGTINTLTASVRAEQPLFTGAMFLAIRIANTFAEISKKGVFGERSELIASVTSAYYNYLLSKEVVALTKLQVQLSEENYRNTESRFRAGLVSEYDKIKASVQYQNSQPMLTEAENNSNLALNNLRLLMGLKISDDIHINDKLEYSLFEKPDYESASILLLQKNNLLQQLKLNTDLRDLSASYEWTKHLPTLNAFGNWQVQAQENDDRSFGEWRYKNSIGIGLNLKVPIFSGLSQMSRVEQSQIDFKIAQESLESTKKALLNQMQSTLLTLEKYEQQIPSLEAALKEAERGYDIAVKRFNTGLGSQIEVTNSMVDFSASKVNYLKAIADYRITYSKLQALFGKDKN
ncbi:MAG: TolC family protein [Ignavibacteriales bacterium]|nr:TolC family protein [Ignavibacteriales bacterium]